MQFSGTASMKKFLVSKKENQNPERKLFGQMSEVETKVFQWEMI